MASVAALRSNANFRSAFSTIQNKKLNLRLIKGGVANKYSSMNRFLIGNTDQVSSSGIEKVKATSLNNKVSNVFNIRKNIFNRMERREEENARERTATVSNIEKVQIESESESDSSSIFSVILTSLLTAMKKILGSIKKIFGYLKNVLPILRKALPALKIILKRFPLIAGIGAVGALIDFLTKKESPGIPESLPATPPSSPLPTPSPAPSQPSTPTPTPSPAPSQPSTASTPSTPPTAPSVATPPAPSPETATTIAPAPIQTPMESVPSKPATVPERVPQTNAMGTPEKAVSGNVSGVSGLEKGILDSIAMSESGKHGYDAMNQGTVGNTIIGSGNSKSIIGKSLTEMTVGEIMNKAARGTPAQRKQQGMIFAAGRYQIIPQTLAGLVKRGVASPNEQFSPAVQDRLAISLLEEAGLSKFKSGMMSPEDFQNRIAKIWAGIPKSTGGTALYGGGANKANENAGKMLIQHLKNYSTGDRSSSSSPNKSLASSESIFKLNNLNQLQEQLKVAQNIIMVIRETNNISTGVNFV